MGNAVEIHWTSGSLEEARQISRFLVQERLVACAQIIPWIESVYLWNNELETAQETKIILKTKQERFEDVKKVIEKNSQYELPEITCIEIADGNQEYLKWIDDSTPDLTIN